MFYLLAMDVLVCSYSCLIFFEVLFQIILVCINFKIFLITLQIIRINSLQRLQISGIFQYHLYLWFHIIFIYHCMKISWNHDAYNISYSMGNMAMQIIIFIHAYVVYLVLLIYTTHQKFANLLIIFQD